MTRVYFEEASPRFDEQERKVFDILSRKGSAGATSTELINLVTHRFAHSIHLLRNKGITITTSFVGDGVYRYTLEPKPLVEVDNRTGNELFREELEGLFDGEEIDFIFEKLRNVGTIRRGGRY